MELALKTTDPEPLSNEALLIAVSRGDRKAYRALYDATSGLLFAICMKLMRDRDAAADVLQEAWFRIWQKAYLFDLSKGGAIGWMVTVTRRCALDRIAHNRRPTDATEVIDDEFLASIPERLGITTAESLALKTCLKRLDQKYTQAILLCYFYGLSHEELSSQLGVPLGTAKSLVFRGLAKLKECLG